MYYLPDGSTIHDRGIIPEFMIECSEENETKLRIQRNLNPHLIEKYDFEELFGFTPVEDLQLDEAKRMHKNLEIFPQNHDFGIESSCDESALSITIEMDRFCGEWVHSQITKHAEYGGVVPVAVGEHLKNFFPLLDLAKKEFPIPDR